MKKGLRHVFILRFMVRVIYRSSLNYFPDEEGIATPNEGCFSVGEDDFRQNYFPDEKGIATCSLIIVPFS